MAEKFEQFAMYGDFYVLEKRHDEGFIQAAFGEGDWVNNERIARLWAFFRPGRFFERVATYQHPEFNCGIHKSHGKPFESIYYTGRGFRKYCRNKNITLHDRQNLSEIIEHFN